MKLWQAESLREIISTNISDEFDRLAALSYVDREIEILERGRISWRRVWHCRCAD